MRVISQDGNWDFPYEEAIFMRESSKVLVWSGFFSEKLMADYRYEDDAIEEMYCMRRAYCTGEKIYKFRRTGE